MQKVCLHPKFVTPKFEFTPSSIKNEHTVFGLFGVSYSGINSKH